VKNKFIFGVKFELGEDFS